MKDIEKLYNLYNKAFSSEKTDLMSCSFDSIEKINLSSSTSECFGFDKIKEIVFNNKLAVCSVDSLYFDISNDKLYFIEFKNQKYRNAKNNFLSSQIDSYITNRYISSFDQCINLKKINLIAVLVLSIAKNSNFFAALNAAKISGSTFSALENLKKKLIGISLLSENLFYKDVLILSEKEFDHKFKKTT